MQGWGLGVFTESPWAPPGQHSLVFPKKQLLVLTPGAVPGPDLDSLPVPTSAAVAST